MTGEHTVGEHTLGEHPVAAIDCGTNSTRLLITDGRGDTIERLMRITRLGQATDATGRLSDEAIERTVAVLREYRAIMDHHGVGPVRVTATSAARDADNREVFLAEATAVMGTRPELLTGADEARLSFQGAARDLAPADGPYLVVDIGGGSTEFAVGDTHALGVASTDMGCVRLTEKYLHHDPPRPE
ncbi:MAG: exopolyphosphatase, partial [Actinomycetota bacterium]|nr:exopolyphosphatase [Actinomycetota bacterium]